MFCFVFQGLSYDHVELNIYLNGENLNCPIYGIKGTVYPVFYGKCYCSWKKTKQTFVSTIESISIKKTCQIQFNFTKFSVKNTYRQEKQKSFRSNIKISIEICFSRNWYFFYPQGFLGKKCFINWHFFAVDEGAIIDAVFDSFRNSPPSGFDRIMVEKALLWGLKTVTNITQWTLKRGKKCKKVLIFDLNIDVDLQFN